MIKTSAIFSAHAIHVFLRNTLIFLLVLFVSLFIWLFAGIKVDTLKVGDFNVGGLYIKLDKKLTLMTDYVIIPKSKEKLSFEDVDRVFDTIKTLFTFFEYIELKNVTFDNNRLNIIFTDDILYVTSDEFEIAGNIHRVGETFEADVSMLYLIKENVDIKGRLTYHLNTDVLNTEGTFDAYNIKGRFSANKIADTVDFKIDSDTFSDLHPIIDKFDLVEGVRSWVVDKVEAQSYELLSLSGKANVDNGQFDMNMDALRGEILFSDVKIHFKEGLEPVLASSFLLSYEKGGLFFDLKNPTYREKNLQGSKVSIVDLTESNTSLHLDIRADTPFDAVIRNLLEAYDLKIPVDQKNGKVKAVFLADIALEEDHSDFVVDMNFTQGDVWLDRVRLPVVKGGLHYEDGFITLKNIGLKDKFYEGNVSGKIDLNNTKADLVFDAKHITLKSEDKTFFAVKDKKLPFVLTYKRDIYVGISDFAMRIHNTAKETKIYLKDLSKIKPYLSDPGPLEKGGNVTFTTKDFKTYTFKGELERPSCFLYEKNRACKIKVPFEGKITQKDTDFYAFNKRFYYNKAKARVKLTNLSIDLKKFLKSKREDNKREKGKKKTKVKQGTKLLILGKDSNLRYGTHTLIMDSYDIDVKANGDFKAIGSASGDIIKFSKKKDIVSLRALRIKDKVFHPLIDFNGLHEGRYSLKSSGNFEGTMKGEIIVEGGVMKDFKAYNNTLAFINTLPALASLQNPGYSTKGFTIEEAVSEYRMIKRDVIIFDSIYIKGSSATIVGKGVIDLKNRTIRMDLAIRTARELGKYVGSVPILGYILMGKDKSMTIGLKIRGTLGNPKVSTSAAKEVLRLPLDLIKRTFESPGQLINK
jgi:hypothetical protein